MKNLSSLTRRFPGLLFTMIALGLATVEFRMVSADDEEPADRSELIRRNQIGLTLAGAELAIRGARRQAEVMDLQVNITVVDEGGHPLAFVRMDGARPASAYTSMTKATSAATQRGETGPLGDEIHGTHLSLAVENAAARSGGKFTTLKGGVPIRVEEQLIGAIGVGGATGEQDAEIARAGVAALLRALGLPPNQASQP